MTRIGIIIGSTRPHRNGQRAARRVHDIATQRDDADFELVDLRDYPLPHLDEPCRRPWATRPPEATQANADLRRRLRPFRGKTCAAQPCGGRGEIWKECDG